MFKKIATIVLGMIVFSQSNWRSGLFAQPRIVDVENYIRIEKNQGYPKAIYNIRSQRYSGNPEEIARQYLLENRDLLRMEKDLSDLKLIEVKKSPAGAHVGFRQYYKGIPVFRSETVISINHENRVSMVFNGHKPGIEVNTVPAINRDQALNLARKAIEVKEEDKNFIPTAELMIYEDSEGKYQLIWKTILYSLKPYGAWMTIVDAHTGKILEKFDTDCNYVNGTGRVFKPDPVTELRNMGLKDSNDADYQLLQPAYKIVSLFDLNNAVGGLYRVRGRYAYSMDIEVPYDSVVNTTNPANFIYKRN